jgi:hypothetical protein
MKKTKSTALTSFKGISNKILEIRGQKVMLDTDLAEIYGVQTKVLNQAVKRNKERFPEDFMFKLTREELSEVVTNCDHLQQLKFTHQMPYAFTEHGALMLSAVLKSDIAVHASLEIVRAFVRMRSMIMANKDLAKKIEALESKLTKHDESLRIVFDTIKKLIQASDEQTKKPIGFHVNMKEERAKVLEKADSLVKEIDKLSSKRRSSKKNIQSILKKRGVVKK